MIIQEKVVALVWKELQVIHANKTGKLLTYPFIAAGLIAELAEPQQEKLRKTGQLLGLAFQVRDDILDETASFEDLGKTPQKDVAAGRPLIQLFWAWMVLSISLKNS